MGRRSQGGRTWVLWSSQKGRSGVEEASFPQRAPPGRVACPCPSSSVSRIKERKGFTSSGRRDFSPKICITILYKHQSMWNGPSWILPHGMLASTQAVRCEGDVARSASLPGLSRESCSSICPREGQQTHTASWHRLMHPLTNGTALGERGVSKGTVHALWLLGGPCQSSRY